MNLESAIAAARAGLVETVQTGPQSMTRGPQADTANAGSRGATRSPGRSGIRAPRIREVELAFQAIIHPYFRSDVFLGCSDAEGVSIERAYLTTTRLPNQPETRLGRFLSSFACRPPETDGRTLNAGSVYVEWFPSEFFLLVTGYEAVPPSGGTIVNRVLLRATFFPRPPPA